MKQIELTQGKFAIVDDEDFERLNQFKWCAGRSRHRFYVYRGVWVDSKVKMISMHREIMNSVKGTQIDHINNNGLDNRKNNLRFCTSQENQQNRINPQKNNNLGIKGVFWHKKVKKFVAQININCKRMYLGCFNVMGDADSAYRIAEEKYFGEFARGRR